MIWIESLGTEHDLYVFRPGNSSQKFQMWTLIKQNSKYWLSSERIVEFKMTFDDYHTEVAYSYDELKKAFRKYKEERPEVRVDSVTGRNIVHSDLKEIWA